MERERDQFDEIAERVASELRAEAVHPATGDRTRVKVRRYLRHEVVRLGHEIGLATAGVVVADHYLVPLVVHVAPLVMG